MHACCLAKLSIHTACRVQWVGVINFGTDRVRVLEKTSGSGMDRVRVLALHFLSIGYYRVLKILIGYFPDKVLSFGSTKVLAALAVSCESGYWKFEK